LELPNEKICHEKTLGPLPTAKLNEALTVPFLIVGYFFGTFHVIISIDLFKRG